MPSPSSSSFETLLAHASFLRSLARELSRDANRADDLVQRTWVAALEHPPGDDKPLRRWLAAIVRNLAHEEHRTETRRTRREALAARPIASSEPDELAEQIALQHSLLRAVSELDEPYRSVIYQRYYEGLAPREIAARSGVALKTVKTHLHRGLAKLRARLDREHGGDRSAWLLAFVPLVGRPSWTVHALGALLVDAKLKVALVCVAVIGVAGSVLFVSSRAPTPIEAREPLTESSTPVSAPLEPPHKLAVAAPVASEEREALETRARASSDVAAAVQSSTKRIHGRVLDTDGRPVGGVEIVRRAEFVADAARERSSAPQLAAKVPPLATSAADGRFELEKGPQELVLQARSPIFVTVLGARVAENFGDADAVVVVATRQPVAGIVVDESDRPVAGASVEVWLPPAVRAGIGVIIDGSFAMAWKTSADERGRFEFDDAPACAGSLLAIAPTFERVSVPLPARPQYDLVIRLTPTKDARIVVRGFVVDAHGAAVEGAHVALGPTTVMSKSDGSFGLDVATTVDVADGPVAGDEPDESNVAGWGRPAFDFRTLTAVKLGFLPAIHALPQPDELRAHPILDPITLTLGGSPLSIDGRVEDTNGKPVASVEIWPLDGTHFGRVTFTSGQEGVSWPATVEDMLRGGPRVDKARSDADGRFTLDGLCDREYRLGAFDARTMRFVRVQHVRAGAHGVVVRVPAEDSLVRIAGRVVSESGTPVPGVRVTVNRDVSGDGTRIFGPTKTTDAEGAFAFSAEVSPDLTFQCTGESILPLIAWQPGPKQKLDQLELKVAVRCHMQVDLGERKGAADTFKALDASGKPSMIWIAHGPMSTFDSWQPITAGKSEAATVSESCKTIVLYKQGKEVARIPVALKPGELNVVTF